MVDDGRSVLRVWWDPPARGAENMARDEALAEAAERSDGVLVRLSTWARPEVSLGAFQRYADACDGDVLRGLPICRRPSGGGAIVHGSDVTLAIAVPRGHRCGARPEALYDLVHDALVEELRARGVPAARSAGVGDRDGRLLCFDRRARGDVVVRRASGGGYDDKVFGSAQRRLRGVVLQHGSLLVAANESVPAAARHPGLAQVAAAAGPWASAAGREAVDGWLGRIARSLGAELVVDPGSFQPPVGGGYEDAVARYGDPAWVSRR